jgi:hypothetical protein
MRIQAGAGIAAFRARSRLERDSFFSDEGHMKALGRTLIAGAITLCLSGCAASFHRQNIADVKHNAGHYADRTVTFDGTVTDSWGLPLVPFKLYKVQDGTGEMTVIARGGRTPVNGSRVTVKGVVRDVAVLGGQPLGLHLEETSLNVR